MAADTVPTPRPLYDPVTFEEMATRMREILEENIEIGRKKNHDYAAFAVMTTGDALANVGDGLGWVGAHVRCGDKMERLKTAYAMGELKNESIEDAFRDLLNYAFYMYILWERRNYDISVEYTEIDKELDEA